MNVDKIIEMARAAREAQIQKAKAAESFSSKKLGDYATDNTGSRFLFPVLGIKIGSGNRVFIEVPKFEKSGISSHVTLSAVSYNSLPSEVMRYKQSAEYAAGLIRVRYIDATNKDGDFVLKWDGLEELDTLDEVKDIKGVLIPRPKTVQE